MVVQPKSTFLPSQKPTFVSLFVIATETSWITFWEESVTLAIILAAAVATPRIVGSRTIRPSDLVLYEGVRGREMRVRSNRFRWKCRFTRERRSCQMRIDRNRKQKAKCRRQKRSKHKITLLRFKSGTRS